MHGLCTPHDPPGSTAHSQHKGTVNGDDEVSTYLLAYVLACPRACQQLAHIMDPHGRALLRLGCRRRLLRRRDRRRRLLTAPPHGRLPQRDKAREAARELAVEHAADGGVQRGARLGAGLGVLEPRAQRLGRSLVEQPRDDAARLVLAQEVVVRELDDLYAALDPAHSRVRLCLFDDRPHLLRFYSGNRSTFDTDDLDLPIEAL